MFLRPAPAPSPASDGEARLTGATWVAATGAFLLVAAAAVFVGVRWETLPDAAKLAVVAALTGSFLAGGRMLRRTLPATGDVVFHLGAFLVPVDVAGMCVRAGFDWRTTLLIEGLIGFSVLGALGRATGSVVLRRAATASLVVLALGFAAVTPLPAPLLLALAAIGAHVAGHRREAITWAAVAGVAPILGAGLGNALEAITGRDLGVGTLTDLGLAGHTAALTALLSGIASAVVLGREATRTRDLGLVALAGISAVSGAVTAWVVAEPSTEVNLLAGPSIFLAVELAAMLARRDPFWRRPTSFAAITGEALTVLFGAPLALLLVVLAPFVEQGVDVFGDAPPWTPQPVAGLALALAAAGWLVAGWRRQSPKPTLAAAVRASLADDRTVLFVATASIAAIVIGTASSVATAVALLALAAGLALTRGVLATVVTVAAAAWAPVVAAVHERAVLPSGLVAAACVVLAAHAWRRSASGKTSAALGAVAALIAVAVSVQAGGWLGTTTAAFIGLAACWAIAIAFDTLDAAVVGRSTARVMTVVAALTALRGSPSESLPVLVLASLALLVGAVRVDEPWFGVGAAVTGPIAVALAGAAAGLSVAEQGVVVAGGAVVLVGFSALLPDRWRQATVVGATTFAIAGLALATNEPERFAEALVLTGALVIAAGASTRRSLVAHAGGAVVTVGIATHLALDGVTASEPFLLPVAIQLVLLGIELRRRTDPPSSWVAFGPAVGVLAGSAIAERVAGGSAVHALAGGAVGVVAIAAGGWLRLAAPLFLGTAAIGVVTFVEALHTLAGIPTWAWLAFGGALLLAVGVVLERTSSSPSEAGRRLVDVVAERFE